MLFRRVRYLALALALCACVLLRAPASVSSAPGMVPSPAVAAMLRAKEVMIGYEDGSMRWSNTVTRAEAVKLLLAAIGEVAPSLSRTPAAFADVSRSHWAYGHITMAAEMGLVRGRPGNIFDPEQGVTMAEFAVMVSRVYAGLGSEAGDANPRVQIKPAWASPEIVGWPDLVDMLVGSSGVADLDYPASRGEVGVLTGNMMNRLGLAYDLRGVLKKVEPGSGGVSVVVDGDDTPVTLQTVSGMVCLLDGSPSQISALVDRKVSLVLNAEGKVSLIVAGRT